MSMDDVLGKVAGELQQLADREGFALLADSCRSRYVPQYFCWVWDIPACQDVGAESYWEEWNEVLEGINERLCGRELEHTAEGDLILREVIDEE